MKDQIEAALDILYKGRDIVTASVTEHSGSTPRKTGAWMIILEDKSTIGSIGGGMAEAKVINLAAQIYKTKKSKSVDFDFDGKNIDTMCGGKISVNLEFVKSSPENIKLFESKKVKKPSLYIFGAGHVSMYTATLACMVNFNITVIDDREEFANRKRFETADQIKVADSFENAFNGLNIDDSSYIVIVTRGHAHDKTVLANALKTDAKYIGMIGSSKKREYIYGRLLEEGFTKEDIKRVHSPIGLNISADTPQEIAVSITAELISVKNS